MLLVTFVSLGLLLQSPAPPADWHSLLDQGKQALAEHKPQDALASLRAAEQAARTAGDSAGTLECLRLEASAARELGDLDAASAIMETAADEVTQAMGAGPDLASILEQALPILRARRRDDLALGNLNRAIAIRAAHPEVQPVAYVNDLAAAADLLLHAGETEKAIAMLTLAIHQWDVLNPADPGCLHALDALASILRDSAHYADAEPLLQRALRLREDLFGPDNAELLATLDSLAYVEFGLKKMPEAEGLYKRMLDLWQKSAGPEHPMVALTYDKMAEFYASQQRYDDAERCANAALDLRMRFYVASLHQNGRILIMEAKIPEAEDLYHRAIQIGELAHAPDDVMDPPLRVYATILRAENHPKEADVIGKRVKDALLRKADREGRKEPPPSQPPSEPRR